MSTQFPTKNGIPRQWHVLDANGEVLGKIASLAANILMGKHKPTYTPFIDAGDHVIVINAEKVALTGKKEGQKVYRHFTGYPGGLVERTVQRVRSTRPQRMIEDAIYFGVFALTYSMSAFPFWLSREKRPSISPDEETPFARASPV